MVYLEILGDVFSDKSIRLVILIRKSIFFKIFFKLSKRFWLLGNFLSIGVTAQIIRLMWVVGFSDYNLNVFSLTNSSLVYQIQRRVSLHKLYMIVSKLLKTYNQHKLFLKIKNIASWVIKHFTLSPSSHSYALCILIRILHAPCFHFEGDKKPAPNQISYRFFAFDSMWIICSFMSIWEPCIFSKSAMYEDARQNKVL